MTTKVKPSVLADTAVSAGTYGGATQHSVFTVDAQGRLTYAGNATPSIATSQLTGTISATQVANNQTYAVNISGTANSATYATTAVNANNATYSGSATSAASANVATYGVTANTSDESNKLATTAYVKSAISSSTPGWNVTYLSTNIASGGSWTVPSNCIGVYIYSLVSGSSSNGGNGRATIKDSGGNSLGSVYINGTNTNHGPDGGSGMTDGAGSFVPLPSNASTVYLDIADNSVTGTFYVQAYVTK